MLFLFIETIICSNATYCGEEKLEEGYWCCNNQPCKYECIGENLEICPTEFVHFCHNNIYILVLVGGIIAMIPTIITGIIGCFKVLHLGRLSLAFSLITNFLFSDLIISSVCAVNAETLSGELLFAVFNIYAVVIIYILGIVIGLIYIIIKRCSKGNVEMRRLRMKDDPYIGMYGSMPTQEEEPCCRFSEKREEFNYPQVSLEVLKEIANDNIALPPRANIFVDGVHHYGNSMKPIQEIINEEIEYGTWSSEVLGSPIPNSGSVVYTCYPFYMYDESMNNVIKPRMNELTGRFNNNEIKMVVVDTNSTDETVALVGTDDCCVKMYNTFFLKLLWFILLFFGYSIILDLIWALKTKPVHHTVYKHIYLNDEGRARKGERDRDFIQTA